MKSYYQEEKKGMSKGTKGVLILFLFSIILTGVSFYFLRDGIPDLNSKVETLKKEKQKKEEELKLVETNLSDIEKKYNELKAKTEKK